MVYKASLFSCLGFLSNRSHQSVESVPLSFDTQNVFFRHSTNTWSLRHHSVERAWNWEAGQDTLSYSYLYMLSWTIHPFRLVITHDLLKDSPIDDVSIKNLLLFHHIKQIVFILMPSVCSVIDKSSPNMVRTPVAPLGWTSRTTVLFSPHFDAICDLDRCLFSVHPQSCFLYSLSLWQRSIKPRKQVTYFNSNVHSGRQLAFNCLRIFQV